MEWRFVSGSLRFAIFADWQTWLVGVVRLVRCGGCADLAVEFCLASFLGDSVDGLKCTGGDCALSSEDLWSDRARSGCSNRQQLGTIE